MCAIHDDRWHDVEHVRDVSEVDHQIVIAEGVAAFGEPNLVCTSVASLFHGVAHVLSAEELSLLDVHGAAGLCCCHQ